MERKLKIFCIAFLLLWATSGIGFSFTIYSNFGVEIIGANGYIGESYLERYLNRARLFRPYGADYMLNSISLVLTWPSEETKVESIWLMEDNNGPATIIDELFLEEVTYPDNLNGRKLCVFKSMVNPTITKGTRYWVAISDRNPDVKGDWAFIYKWGPRASQYISPSSPWQIRDSWEYTIEVDGTFISGTGTPTTAPPLPELAIIDLEPDDYHMKWEENPKFFPKKRMVKCYISLPTGYDVEDVDLGTLVVLKSFDRLEVPFAHIGDLVKYGDANEKFDLLVNFDFHDVESKPGGGEALITVSGELYDGSRFEGTDIVNIIPFED